VSGAGVALDLDALADTRPLWDAWLESVRGLLELDPGTLPRDRSAAAAELDRSGAGNWRALLERFAEERAPVYLRRDPAVSAALRALEANGCSIAVFTDAPAELARVVLGQLGAERRIGALAAGADALGEARAVLGDGATVVRTRVELLELGA
jgi:FMN phosphatase YigB (HAD superfamily)